MLSDAEEQEIYKAIEESIAIQNEYKLAIEKLSEENQFLSDTILNKKLGKIATERQELLDKVRKERKEAEAMLEKADNELNKANSLKISYEQKVKEIADTINDVREKQQDVNKFIEEKAKIIVSKKVEELNLERNKLEKEKDLLKKEKENYEGLYKAKLQKTLLILVPALLIIFAILLFVIK